MDRERMDAEARARQMGVALGMPGNELSAIAHLSDDDLRRSIVSMRLKMRGLGAPLWPEAQRQTIEHIGGRLVSCGALPQGVEPGDVLAHLRDQFDVDVAQDGLVEAGRLTAVVRELIGESPIALFHHTSSALLPSIERHGLIIGAQTNFFNTQAGVYLSTRRAGEPVEVYGRRAARAHGGEPVAIRVRRTLAQIRPDPDDADLAWAQGVQFISSPVPPVDVLLHDAGQAEEAKACAPGVPGVRQRGRST